MKKLEPFVLGIFIPLIPILLAIMVLMSIPEEGANFPTLVANPLFLPGLYGSMLLAIPFGLIGMAYINKHLEETAPFALFSRIICVLDFVLAICLVFCRVMLMPF